VRSRRYGWIAVAFAFTLVVLALAESLRAFQGGTGPPRDVAPTTAKRNTEPEQLPPLQG
jgi:hypothetical protein